MSEKVLKALLQLFAIVARPQREAEENEIVVEEFLKQQLNQELVEDYLKVFNEYYDLHQKRHSEKSKRKKRFASSSVRVLKICTEINQELTQAQKVVVLIRLLEFVKSEDEITQQELEFLSTVAETFHIPANEYRSLKAFIHNPFDIITNPERVLLVDNNLINSYKDGKHLHSSSLTGQIRIYHAMFANMYIMRYIGDDELYLNGQLLQQERVHVLNSGSSIKNPKIAPIYYSDIVSAFKLDRTKSRIAFEVSHVSYFFKNNAPGLQDINFLEKAGNLIGIMGSSGTGKTTLLNVLNGSSAPTTGEVLINGYNVHKEEESLEGIIGYVSQDDLLIEELTVFQNLYFNAKLCFDNYSKFQLLRTVLRLLRSLGLYDIKHMKVGNPLDKKISGGQRKRLNIALEIIREPAILFLDEPTSGLSSRDSENILDLLKELALKDKLVFAVIHQPSSDIFKMFDKLIILDVGGYMIYSGDPVDSIIYFKSRVHQANWNESECHCCGNVNPEQIFNIVEAEVVDEYGNLTQTRKTTPREWHKHFKEFTRTKKRKSVLVRSLPDLSFKIPNKLKQFKVFMQRDVLSKLNDAQYLIINLLETPLLAFLLSYIIKYYSVDAANELGYTFIDNSNLPVYIFMSVIVAIFVGLTVSAEEIIKDRKILKRESFLNLSRASYLMSKIAILLALSAFQAFTYVIIGNSIMEIKGMYFEYWLVLFSAWCSANLMGLNISDAFKTSVTIYILIPFLIIPQIILSGVIVKYDKLNPEISSPNNIPFYGELMTARWAYEALAVYQFKYNEYDRLFYSFEKTMSRADYKKNYWLRTLDNKINSCERNLDDPERKEQVKANLFLLRNEIRKELDKTSDIADFNAFDKLYYEKLDKEAIASVKEYINTLNEHYIDLYNMANRRRDRQITQLQQTKEEKKAFLKKKRMYHNESLTDFVKNANDLVRIVEYKGELYQKLHPIYHDPSAYFLKAHFYAPRKKIFGSYFDTFWVNIGVIWFLTIVLYITLYYRVIHKAINFFEQISTKLRTKK